MSRGLEGDAVLGEPADRIHGAGDAHAEAMSCVADYDALDWEWSMFNPEAKRRRHEEVFPKERQAAYERGAALAR